MPAHLPRARGSWHETNASHPLKTHYVQLAILELARCAYAPQVKMYRSLHRTASRSLWVEGFSGCSLNVHWEGID